MRTDLGSNIATNLALSPQTVTNTAVYGSGIDRKGYESAVVTFFMGSVHATVANQTITFSLQESSDDGSADAYAAISGTETVITATNTATEVSQNLIGIKRYIRVYATPAIAGATPHYIIAGAVVTLGSAKTLPV